MDGRPPVPQGTQSQQQSRNSRSGGIIKALCLFGVLCLIVYAAATVLLFGSVIIGVRSCVRSLYDDPIGDTPETAAFIADPAATERDIEVLDALAPELGKVFETLSLDEGEHALSIEELRTCLEQGAWPTDPAGYGGPDRSRSPQLWVRIAELSEDTLEAETGEEWRVIDFSYPFPNNGPIPFPPKRESGDCTITRLVCVEGSDAGLITNVRYFRWNTLAFFDTGVEEARERYQGRIAFREQVEALGFIDGRTYAIDGRNVYVWARSLDDELLETSMFLDCANNLAELGGNYSDLIILKPDAPMALEYNPLSNNYPNSLPARVVSASESRTTLELSGHVYTPLVAEADILLRAHRETGNPSITEEDIEGSIVPKADASNNRRLRLPNEGAVFDEGTAHLVADTLGIDAQDVIASVEYSEDNHSEEKYVLLLLPQGSVPETFAGYTAVEQSLIDAIWDTLTVHQDKRTSLFVHIFVVEQDGIRNSAGDAVPFSEVRSAAAEDPANLGSYTFSFALSSMPSSMQ